MSNNNKRNFSDLEEIDEVLNQAVSSIVTALTYLDLVAGVDPKGLKLENYNKAREANLICEDRIYKAKRFLSNHICEKSHSLHNRNEAICITKVNPVAHAVMEGLKSLNGEASVEKLCSGLGSSKKGVLGVIDTMVERGILWRTGGPDEATTILRIVTPDSKLEAFAKSLFREEATRIARFSLECPIPDVKNKLQALAKSLGDRACS
jgi:hypothetical protein